MTVDEYLAHQPEGEKADSKPVLSILDSEAEVWNRVWWRLLDEQFLGWYIWLKDNLVEVKEWGEEVRQALKIYSNDFGCKSTPSNADLEPSGGATIGLSSPSPNSSR